VNFQAHEDLRQFQSAIDHLAERYRQTWQTGVGRFEHAPQLEEQLQEGGFFTAFHEPTLGPVAATAMVQTLAQLPVCAEVAASALLGPLACPEGCGPIAVIHGALGRPTRFLPTAGTLVHLQGSAASVATLENGQAETLESLFAYPMGRLRAGAAVQWQVLAPDVAERLHVLWPLAIAAELVGCLQAALQSVLDHVKQRQQFGRPIGSFQAVQHRLAQASCAIEAAHWLTLQAADSGQAVDAATALGYAQQHSGSITYDLHQFMGAMGLTLEHPLHRWTYRIKLLRSELGGASRQLQQAATLAWPQEPTP
jgi:Acyl-CoA dehydrogenase, C-terminal domain